MLLAVLGLLAAGCTGGGGRSGRVPHAHAEESFVTFDTPPSQVPDPTPDVTAEAKVASRTLVRMAGIIGSWNLAPSILDPLTQQIAYVDDALQEGNRLGAEVLLSAWKSNAEELTKSGMISSADGAQYQALASEVQSQLPGTGQVMPFTQPGAPRVSQSGRNCGGSGPLDVILGDVRILTSKALTQVPSVGWLLSGLFEIMWPIKATTPQEIWVCLRDEVSGVVQRKIAEQKVKDLDAVIEGLKNVIGRYIAIAQKSTDASVIRSYWHNAQTQLDAAGPQFKSATPEYVALPEFAEWVNLNLSSLRDGILNAGKIGLSAAEVDVYKEDFTKSPGIISEAETWVSEQYKKGYNDTPFVCTRKSGSKCYYQARDEFNSKNKFDMVMIPAVKDQAWNWPYYDPVTHPVPVQVPPDTRVIFSPAFGSGNNGAGNSGGVIKPDGTAQDPITHITVWAGKCPGCFSGNTQIYPVRVAGWQVTFGNKPGTQEPGKQVKYGYTGSTVKDISTGAVGDFPPPTGEQAIVTAYGSAGDIIDAVAFTRANKQDTGWIGATNKQSACNSSPPGPECYSISFPDEILAAVYSSGNNTKDGWNSPHSIVFGFRYADSWGP